MHDIHDLNEKLDEAKSIIDKIQGEINLINSKYDPTDPRYMNVPNICFSRNDPSEGKREEQFALQRKARGFDDSETWNLYCTISNFILPRLKAYKNNKGGSCPVCFNTEAEWDAVLDKMISAFSLKEDNEEDEKEGLKLFAEYFWTLWW